jgi:hypothetical protein
MRDLVRLQGAVTEPGARIAVDHSIFHLDADLRWLEAAAGHVKDGERRR